MLLESIVLCLVLQCAEKPALKFERTRIGDAKVIYEAASACDVDNDGTLDIVSGEYWFKGPDFKAAHKICDVRYESEYHDDFSDYPMDVNGDGYVDIVTGGWFGAKLAWRENPKGGTGLWTTHDIDACGNVETTRFWDVDGDGQVEAVPNAGGRVAYYKLVCDAAGKGTGKFSKHVVKPDGCGHGLGFGDVNGDGRGDFIIPDGWIEAPADRAGGAWTFHQEFSLGSASVPVLVHDVNADGRADLIVGQAHNFGLDWYAQVLKDGKRTWAKHSIDATRSQYHDMQLVDIDKDGQLELITGQRYRAHNGNDPGEKNPIGLYYFKTFDKGATWERTTLDYGPATHASGAGIYFWVADVDKNGWLDIVAPGKQGLYLFKNLGPAK